VNDPATPSSDERRRTFMRDAIRLSRESVRAGGGPFGAVVVRGDDLLGRGQNRVTLLNDPTAHAEILAIRQACETLRTFCLNGCELFTSCEPCPMCLGAILWARLDRIWYANTREDAAAIGFDDGRFYGEFTKPANQRTVPMTPFLREEALTAFADWEDTQERRMY
jgi:tRNA(Arg) A34 adenosine deaminase TadA